MELSAAMAGPLRLIDGLQTLDRSSALDDFPAEVLAAVRGPLEDDAVDVLAVTRAIAHVNDQLTSRVLRLAEARLGPPPCDYAWLSLGSHGRGEQVLSSDQDSALAYAAGVDVGAYFSELAERVVLALERAGLPLCAGGYMATSWCRPVGELRALFADWVDQPEPEALLRAEVFLDVRPVHGTLDVDELDRTLVVAGTRGPFQVQMARAAVTFRPPLRAFGRLRTDDGAVDVKRAGTAAIVLLARLYALTAGSSARDTSERLQTAAVRGVLSPAAADELLEAYRSLTRLRLRWQVEQVAAGRRADNRVPLDRLTSAERDHLRDALRTVRDVQTITASRFATHTVT